MRKLLFLGVAILISVVVGVPVCAQETGNKEMEKSTAKKPSGPSSWVIKGEGIRVAYVSSFKPSEEPEFAILRLADAEYKKFQEKPKDWVNDHHIFKKPVNVLHSCPAAKPEKDPPGDEPFWYVMLPHYPSSNAMCVSYPAVESP